MPFIKIAIKDCYYYSVFASRCQEIFQNLLCFFQKTLFFAIFRLFFATQRRFNIHFL